MSARRYIISEASKLVNVESHVLRYWEEELDLKIPRNEMGHRYYLEENINTLKLIKKLKEQGFQLRAIKMVLPDMKNVSMLDDKGMHRLREEMNAKALQMEASEAAEEKPRALQTGVEQIQAKAKQAAAEEKQSKIHMFPGGGRKDAISTGLAVAAPVGVERVETEHGEKMIQFKTIMKGIMAEAVEEQKESLAKGITEEVTNRVIKEMDYMMRMQDEQSDERFKQLEAVITGTEKSKKEAAATADRRKKRFFFRNNKKTT